MDVIDEKVDRVNKEVDNTSTQIVTANQKLKKVLEHVFSLF